MGSRPRSRLPVRRPDIPELPEPSRLRQHRVRRSDEMPQIRWQNTDCRSCHSPAPVRLRSWTSSSTAPPGTSTGRGGAPRRAWLRPRGPRGPAPARHALSREGPEREAVASGNQQAPVWTDRQRGSADVVRQQKGAQGRATGPGVVELDPHTLIRSGQVARDVPGPPGCPRPAPPRVGRAQGGQGHDPEKQ